MSIRDFFRDKVFIFLSENGKIITQFLFTASFIFLAAWFVLHEKTELHSVSLILSGADIPWVLAGLFLVLFYILIQGLMYVTSFASIDIRLKLWPAIILFLKRNFISVFLPAGAVSSLAFFNSDIEKKRIHQITDIFCFRDLCFCWNSFSSDCCHTFFSFCYQRGKYRTWKMVCFGGGGFNPVLVCFSLLFSFEKEETLPADTKNISQS